MKRIEDQPHNTHKVVSASGKQGEWLTLADILEDDQYLLARSNTSREQPDTRNSKMKPLEK